jgi:glucose-1-phosphate adenylyltransferase
MKNVMGMILSGGKNTKLKELSTMRSSPAVPVGGKYRAIDFVLSSMVNSGITNVGVILNTVSGL